ncbi:MAG: AbrB/MazE/SpoVT family DNA-binding domain-containing protein [Hyphomonadaceae bacterium]
MTSIKSKITAQGQVSVPAEVRKQLGVGPGGVIEWQTKDGDVIVRRAGKFTFEDLHKAAFPDGPPSGPPVDVKKAIERYMRERHARR